MRQILLSSFYRSKNGSTERFSCSLKVTQLETSRAGIQTHADLKDYALTHHAQRILERKRQLKRKKIYILVIEL